jgi:hypothetical protein
MPLLGVELASQTRKIISRRCLVVTTKQLSTGKLNRVLRFSSIFKLRKMRQLKIFVLFALQAVENWSLNHKRLQIDNYDNLIQFKGTTRKA